MNKKSEYLELRCDAIKLFIVLFFSLGSVSFAQHDNFYQPDYFFIENQGQLSSDILFYSDMGNSTVLITNQGLSICKYKIKDFKSSQISKRDFNESSNDSICIWNIDFLNMNNSLCPTGKNQKRSYSNYLIGSDSSKWLTNVPHYSKVLCKNVWPEVDVLFYFFDNKLKYDYIVRNGGNYEDIVLHYDGVDSLNINNHELWAFTSSGIWKEKIPESYIIGEFGRKEVSVTYEITNEHIVSFSEIPVKAGDQSLIIDPVVFEYSTFVDIPATTVPGIYGRAFEIEVDSNGFLYACGYYANVGFITTPGVFSANYIGGSKDAFVLKLDQSGSNLIYSTFIGGNGGDECRAMDINEFGEVFFTGVTTSSNLPVSLNAFQSTHSNPSNNFLVDAFVGSLNNIGTGINYLSYFGGTGSEYPSALVLDSNDNAFITGQTGSNDFDVTNNAYDVSFNGMGDIFVMKFSQNGSNILFGTYLGGMNVEEAFDIALTKTQEVIICGGSSSTNFPTTNNVFQQNLNGQEDIVVAKLSADGANLEFSTFVGGSANEAARGIDLDSLNMIYLTGYTNSSDFPTVSAYSSVINGSTGHDIFVLKLDSSGSNIIYSTYLGGSFLDSGRDIQVNKNGEAWIIGTVNGNSVFTNGNNNVPITLCSYDDTYNVDQTSYNPGGDIYLAKLSKLGDDLLWATFIGSSSIDVPWEIEILENCGEQVYIACHTQASLNDSIIFPVTQGAFQTTQEQVPSSRPVLIKFSFYPQHELVLTSNILSCTETQIIMQALDSCNFLTNWQDYYNWSIDMGDGTTYSNIDSLIHTFSSTGDKTITFSYVACDSSFASSTSLISLAYSSIDSAVICSGDDFTFLDSVTYENIFDDLTYTAVLQSHDGCDSMIITKIMVTQNPVNASSDQLVCLGDTVILLADNPYNASITWSNNLNPGQAFIPDSSQYYWVTAIDSIGCLHVDSTFIEVVSPPDVTFMADTLIGCENLLVQFLNLSSHGSTSCFWTFGDGFVSNNCFDVEHNYTAAGIYSVNFTITDTNGCTNNLFVTDYIQVIESPNASFAPSSSFISNENSEIQFYNNSSNAIGYIWNFGDSSDLSNEENPNHTFVELYDLEDYTVRLVAKNELGCIDSASTLIKYRPELLYYIPNTFTPDGNIHNETFLPIFISGYNPYEYQLTIFNRWGEIIFESYDPEQGWNGHYGDQGLVTDGTYIWLIEFSESSTSKKHSIMGHVNVLR